jgi:hypothetical protein
MRLKNKCRFDSLKNFKDEIDATNTLIQALEIQIEATRELLKFTKAESKPEYTKYKNLLEVSEKQIEKLYELGFVAFFANFECFMFEFLKELFRKYPSSFKSEKIVRFEDIKGFENVSDIKDYFIDSYAIEKSYDIETWTNFLAQKFDIKIFKNKKDLQRFKALNSLRNLILHSGSKTNSKFRNEMKIFIKSSVPLGRSFNLDRKKYFAILYAMLKLMIITIERK